QGVTASGVSYNSTTGILTVDPTHSFKLSGSLTGLSFVAAQNGNDTNVTFVAPAAGAQPSIAPPPNFEGAAGTAVLVPDIVINMPLPATPPSDLSVTLTLKSTSATPGTFLVGTDNGNTSVNYTLGGTMVTLKGTLGAVERSLQTLT